MRVFLTGGTGFIGGALARRLAEHGHEITSLARDPARVAAGHGIRYVPGDLDSESGLDAARFALRQADLVAHLAAVRKDWGLSMAELRRINVASGPRLMDLARNAQRFLFISSTAVYGHSTHGPASERSAFAPAKRYGVSKVEAEQALRAASRRTGVPLTIARPGIIYGPGDTYGMVANLARLLARGRFLRVGSGKSRLNLLHVEDLTTALHRALRSPDAPQQDFIFAGPQPVTVDSLIEVIARLVGRRLPALRVPEGVARLVARILERSYRTVDCAAEPFLTRAKVDLFTQDDLYDTEKARTILGFSPMIGLAPGAIATVAWLRAAGELA